MVKKQEKCCRTAKLRFASALNAVIWYRGRLRTLTSTIGSCTQKVMIDKSTVRGCSRRSNFVLIIPLVIKITGRGGNESELSQGSGVRELKTLVTFVWPMSDLHKKWSCMPHGFSALFRLELTQALVSKEVRFCDGVINTTVVGQVAENVRDHKPISPQLLKR